jgi:hypothetical protein
VQIDRDGGWAASDRTLRVDGQLGRNQIALRLSRERSGRYTITVQAPDGMWPRRLRVVVR